MSKLLAKDPKEAEPSKPKILIFGKAGVGKTWTSLDFPNVYYIDTEGGATLNHYTDRLKNSRGAYMGQDEGSLSFDTVIGQIQALATESHHYKTLVIDSISKLWNTAIVDAAERFEKAGQKNEFGRDRKEGIKPMRRLISWVDKLDMNVVFIAHEKPEWMKGEQIGVTFDAWDKLAYELDLNLEIVKQGDSRYALVRKSRLVGFPDASKFPWSFEEFSSRYGKDIIDRETKSIELASEEQVKEINRLLEFVKLEEGQLETWFNKAGVESFKEMKKDVAQKCLDFLNKKVKGENK